MVKYLKDIPVGGIETYGKITFAPSPLKVKVKKLHEDAILPTYATDGSGCFDIYGSPEIKSQMPTFQSDPEFVGVYKTGLAFEIPYNHVMLVFSRSGHGFNHGIRLANCVGVIDSDYRGELKIKLVEDFNTELDNLPLEKNSRIAQGLIIPYPKVEFELVKELGETQRGTGGFGSTGK